MNNTTLSNPWPGLGSYDETGRYKFCGRSRATNELYSLISNNSIISLFGRSGIGKTSLLKAGVSPLLARKGFLPVYVRLSQEEKVPDDHGGTLSYAECIVRCLEKKMEENGFVKSEASWEIIASENTDFLWSYFCKTAFQSSVDAHCTPVIILDQFEEIFLDRREDAAMLMRQLYVLVNGSRRLSEDLDYDAFRSRFRFVMSFRDDSLYRLEDVINEYNLASFKENRYLLKALNRDDAMDVVTEPGEDLVDADVVNRILDKVVAMGEGCSVDPAILSLLMYGLYERMIQKGDASIHGVLVDEASNDIVRDFYERRMSGMELSARKYLEEHLVSSDGRRRSVAAADACSHVKVEELESLTDKHILTKLERGSFSDYELTHDVLCPIVTASRAETDAKEKIAKNKRMARILFAIVVAVLAIVAVFFFQNKHLKEERWKALGNQSMFVAEKALQLAKEGDACLAKLLLINTMPSNLDDPERPLTAESASALGKVFDDNSAILEDYIGFYSVNSASYSPDGKNIVSVASNSAIRIWDASTGACLKVLNGHTNYALSASYSPDGKRIVSASYDSTLRIWDASTGACLRVLRGHTNYVSSASYSPDGKRIVSASNDGTIRIWNASNGACLKVLAGDFDERFGSASYSPDGKRIVSASGIIMIWDASTGACLKVLNDHTNYVRSASYSPDGKNIVSASDDNTLRIWDASTGACLKVLKGHTDYVYSASYSPDGKRIVSASQDETVRIWDASTGACLKVLKGHTDYVRSASYSPDGKRIVTTSGTIRIWDVSNEACLKVLNGHTGSVNSASYSPDGKSIVSASYDSLKIWDVSTGACLNVLNGHTGYVNSASYSPDGKSIVSASVDDTVRIWDASTGACLKVLNGHTGSVNSASYSPDGKRIVSASKDNTMRIWDASTGACLKVLKGHTSWVLTASYSPDGKSIVSASDDSTLRIWDASTGACLKVLKGHTDCVLTASYSPDGKRIVSASYDNTMRIWDASTGACLKVLNGHTDCVRFASYSPDGKSIVSASDDNTMRIWDVSTGACLKVLNGHTDYVNSASYSPDGKRIVSASRDRTVRIWDAPPSLQDMIKVTRERFKNRQLTPEEKHRYYLD